MHMRPQSYVLSFVVGISALVLGACASGPSATSSLATPPAPTPVAAAPAPAQPAAAAATPTAVVTKVDYEKQVKPIFAEYCYKCHGLGKHSEGLSLDVQASAMRRINPGNPDRSGVYRAMISGLGSEDHMPPSSEDQPSAADIATIRQWIAEGATWGSST